jgi:type I restriction enzyme M protein
MVTVDNNEPKKLTLPTDNTILNKKMAKTPKTEQEEPLEKKLWKAADKLRKNMDAAEYKHVALGLIFLKYISDAFEEQYQKLVAQKSEGADPEDKNEYLADKIFFVPVMARWAYIQGRATQPTIGKDIDDAMDAIEKDNPSLRGVLPKVFAQEKLDKASLGGLVNLVGSATLGTKEAQSKDLLGQVFEFFLGEFALAEGKKGGQFYTPQSVVKLLVEMLEPYEGRVFDPCCGSGGMFVQSEKFIKSHQDHYKKKGKKGLDLKPEDRISIYGQESNQTTWRLAKMNLSIRGIDSSNVKWNNEGSFLNDAHKDLKADYIIANPPFNDSDWSGELLRDDARWKVLGEKLTPPTGNANYAWIQHFLYHLAPTGQAGFVLSKGALTTNTTGEGEIRKALIEKGLVDCIVNLPTKLFLNTQIPACLWFLSRNKTNGGPSTSSGHVYRKRENEILFIDARNMGFLINRKNRDLSDDDINLITGTYHNWRNPDGNYEDVAGFCKVATIEEVAKLNYVLTPGRYVGLADEDDDFDFVKRFTSLKAELEKQIAEEGDLNKKIVTNLAKIKLPIHNG